MPRPVCLIGAARTDFRRNLRKEGKSLRDLVVEAGRGALADGGIDPGDVQSGVVGNFAAGLFTRQLHLGSFLTDIDAKLRGIPTLHTEAACASGGVAMLTAAQQIMAGACDVALVVGVEQQKTMSPADGADVLGAAADFAAEKAEFGEFMFPKLFGRIAREYSQRYPLSDRDLATVAVKNYSHAHLNPQAQMREVELTMDAALGESAANPRIAPPLKITDCSQITDGAAAVVLCSQEFADRLASKHRILLGGFGWTTDHLPLSAKDVPTFSMATRSAEQAYERAGLTPADIDGADVHDCFSISEIIAYEILGFADRGAGPALLRSGATMLPIIRNRLALRGANRSIPINPGGGLIGDGHPVGATGVRQAVEAYRQLTATAGDRQIDGARNYLTFNMGGTMTTNITMIWSNTA
jgi:acetyl-CoA acetyltransferase